MDIEEARKVLWLKNNHQPLGKLLDEGVITRSNLEWAAQRAYKQELREAARILLKGISPSPEDSTTKQVSREKASGLLFSPGITIEQARATHWPFPPYKDKEMGLLLDNRQLTLKDLGYAIENAWDGKVKKAAIALSLIRLEQAIKEPTSTNELVPVTKGGRSYAEKKQLQISMGEGLFLGISLTLASVFAFWQIIAVPHQHSDAKPIIGLFSTPSGIFSIFVLIVLIILTVWLPSFSFDFLLKRMDMQIEYYRLGQEGEDRVVQSIIQTMDGNWHLFRNVSIPGRNKADLDLVLIGPPGVWALEVKNYRGEYRNIGAMWEYRQGNKWKPAVKNPSKQAINNALRLSNFLKADKIKTYINAAVVWANPEGMLTVENPSIAIWNINNLADELGNIWEVEKVSKRERAKIIDKLKKLCNQ